jgi:FdhD protein
VNPIVEVWVGEVSYNGQPASTIERAIPVECPIAMEVNGVAYAVMMGTPDDLEDYAVGFALSERMIDSSEEIDDLAVSEIEQGVILRLSLAARKAGPLLDRVRMRVSEGSCGLCGLESIAEVLRPLPVLAAGPTIEPAAIERTLLALSDYQTGGTRTGAMHAAAFSDPDGTIRLIREDVGRHNALDKLIGALARAGIQPFDGFIVVTARCSYELVEKTVRAGCSTLVAISAPTSLALERARASGLTLFALARRDTALVASDPHHAFSLSVVA